jgi:hypothetical protein
MILLGVVAEMTEQTVQRQANTLVSPVSRPAPAKKSAQIISKQ